jgi:hypothetical protein
MGRSRVKLFSCAHGFSGSQRRSAWRSGARRPRRSQGCPAGRRRGTPHRDVFRAVRGRSRDHRVAPPWLIDQRSHSRRDGHAPTIRAWLAGERTRTERPHRAYIQEWLVDVGHTDCGVRAGVVRLAAICGGMCLWTTQRRRKDKSLARFLQLAHTRRVGGVTREEVCLTSAARTSLTSRTCAAGASVVASGWSIAASRVMTTCAPAAATTGSPTSGCATAPKIRRQRSRVSRARQPTRQGRPPQRGRQRQALRRLP